MGDLQVLTANDARERALAVIKSHTEAVSFVRQEDLDTQGMFLPVVSVVPITPADVHQLGGGSLMPKSHHVNRMGEAAGVNVTSVEVTHPSPYVWVAKAHGTKRMPDGSMREGEGEYSFDAEKYAELDFLKDEKGRYTSDASKRIHLLEYAKFGHQRASSGARLALIRFFCKCPTAFKRDDMPRAMIFARVDLNTDGLLQAPEMREAAIAHAVGATRTLFGPAQAMVDQAAAGMRNITPATDTTGQAAGGSEPAEEDPFADAAQPIVEEETPEQKARQALEEWLLHEAVAKHAKAPAAIRALLARQDAKIEELNDMLAKCRALAGKRGAA